MGSVWNIVSIDELAIDGFQTKPLRGSSYSFEPENTIIQNVVGLS